MHMAVWTDYRSLVVLVPRSRGMASRSPWTTPSARRSCPVFGPDTHEVHLPTDGRVASRSRGQRVRGPLSLTFDGCVGRPTLAV